MFRLNEMKENIRRCFFCGSFLLFVLHVCHVSSLQPCGHLPGRAVLLALIYMMFSCVLKLSHMVWYLIVLIPNLCPFPYFCSNDI